MSSLSILRGEIYNIYVTKWKRRRMSSLRHTDWCKIDLHKCSLWLSSSKRFQCERVPYNRFPFSKSHQFLHWAFSKTLMATSNQLPGDNLRSSLQYLWKFDQRIGRTPFIALVSWFGNHCCQGCQWLCHQFLWMKGKKTPRTFPGVWSHIIWNREIGLGPSSPSMTTCLEQEASLWLENWLIAWYLLRTRGGFGSQYIWTRQYFPSQPETWCLKMLL